MPSTFKDFTILEKLGQGSFGSVYKVLRAEDRQVYVLKRIALDAMGPAERALAVQECWLMASLSSPYVVRYYDSFNDEGALGIVMELCSGGDLQRALKARAGGPPLAEAEVWRTFLHILLGVAYLHSRRTLHRDLKTANVFLTGGSGRGSVKLGDLGVARVLGSETAFARTCVGTPYYLSPELCQNQPYNEKSDMWACGIILYELCTGKHPFDARNQASLILKIVAGSYAPVSAEHYSPALRSLVDALLCRDSRRRPTAVEVLATPGVAARAEAAGLELPAAAKNVLAARAEQEALRAAAAARGGAGGSSSSGGSGGGGGGGGGGGDGSVGEAGSGSGSGSGSGTPLRPSTAAPAPAAAAAGEGEDFPQEDTDSEALRLMERLLQSCNAESLSASLSFAAPEAEEARPAPAEEAAQELPSSQQWREVGGGEEGAVGGGGGSSSSGGGSSSSSGGGGGGGGRSGGVVHVANAGALQMFLGSLGISPAVQQQQQQQHQLQQQLQQQALTAAASRGVISGAPAALQVAGKWLPAQQAVEDSSATSGLFKEGTQVFLRRRLAERERVRAGGGTPEAGAGAGGRSARGAGRGAAGPGSSGRGQQQQQQQQQRQAGSTGSNSSSSAQKQAARRAPLPLSQEALDAAAAAAAAREAKKSHRSSGGGSGAGSGAGAASRRATGASLHQQQQQRPQLPAPAPPPTARAALEEEEYGVLGALGRPPSAPTAAAAAAAAAAARSQRERAREAAEVAALPDRPSASKPARAAHPPHRPPSASSAASGAASAAGGAPVSVHLLQAVSAAPPPIAGLAPATDSGAYAYNLGGEGEGEEEGEGEGEGEGGVGSISQDSIGAGARGQAAVDFSAQFEVGEEEEEEEEAQGETHAQEHSAAQAIPEEVLEEEEEEEEEEEDASDWRFIGAVPGQEDADPTPTEALAVRLLGEEGRLCADIAQLRDRVEEVIPPTLIPAVLALLAGGGEEGGGGGGGSSSSAPPEDLPAPAWLFIVRLQHLEGKLAEVRRELAALGVK